jgi:hypothetical protein
MTAMRSPVNWIHVLYERDAEPGEKDTKIIALRSGDGTYLLFVQTSLATLCKCQDGWKESSSAAPTRNRCSV